MKEIFRNRAFRKLFFASITSQLGSTIGNMAFAFYLLDRFADRPAYATLAELMYSLPTLAVFFVVGVLADRMDRKRICAWSDWIRAALTAGLLGAVYLGWMPLIFAILFVRSAVGKFFAPAESGLVQGVLKPEQYDQAAGLNQMVFGLFMLFGMGLGAVAYHYVGVEGAIILDGLSFLVSGLLIQSCQAPLEARLPNGSTLFGEIRFGLVLGDFKEGLLYIWRNRLLMALLMGFFIFGFINGAFSVLPMFTMKYKLSPEEYQTYSSLFAICLGAGLLPGSAAGAYLVKRLGYIRLIVAGLLLDVVFGTVMTFTDHIGVYLAATFLLGFAMAPVNVAIGGWLPQIIRPSLMGRVNAWMDPIMMLAHSISLGLIALLYPRWVSLEALYLGVGGCILAVALYYAVQLPKLWSRHQQGIEGKAGEAANVPTREAGASL